MNALLYENDWKISDYFLTFPHYKGNKSCKMNSAPRVTLLAFEAGELVTIIKLSSMLADKSYWHSTLDEKLTLR